MTERRRFVDLHVHTNASDGIYAPAEIVRLAILAGLGAIAITDHDTMNGVAEALAAAADTSLLVVPGVELSTDVTGGEVHILGYYLDPDHPELASLLATLRNARRLRAQKMVEKLGLLKMPISWERVQELAEGGSVGRPHVARALMEAGHVSSVADAFSLYIGREGPAYVERFKLTPREAVALVSRLGGVPVLAHPSFGPNLDALLPDLVAAGLGGLEAYYTGHTPEITERYRSLAKRYGLVATGGSDFHGAGAVSSAILGSVQVPYAAVEQLSLRRAHKSA